MEIWKLTKPANIDGTKKLPRGAVIDPDTKNFAALKRMGFVELVKTTEPNDVVVSVGRHDATDSTAEKPDTSAGVADETPSQGNLIGHDLSLLDNSIDELVELMSVVDDPEHLAALLLAEQSGKTRSGAVRAIELRLSELNDD